MGFFANLFSGIGEAISKVGEAIAEVTTGIANVVSTAVSAIDEGISWVGDKIAEATADIPIINGITAAVATVVDGVTDAAEIVTHHFAMNVAQVGQAVGEVIDTTGEVVEAVAEGNAHCVPEIIKEGVGEIVETAEEHLAMHLEHDIELLQIPIKVVSEATSELLTGVIGENHISQAPLLLDDAQSFVFDDVIHDGIFVPVVDGWEHLNNEVFGNTVDGLSHSEMGMGWLTGEHDGHGSGEHGTGEHGGHGETACGCGTTEPMPPMPPAADEFMWV
ncbi:hypothetical protein G5S52_14495 [Grimontia sp. S25]|uniref:Uncharacterized protein n=1 Tax=Grimontia sedimenti TaxID=2711294 RepID=A0A6M1RLQ0_9GAMM|nr:hypothetical protein [Grimontia sedimenti]NGN98808.1 hypothetical protein [Grimontia sedimenti]